MSAFRVVAVPPGVADDVRSSRADGHGNVEIASITASGPGYPCRICLKEAEPGEDLVLFSYTPFARPVPYRSVGPIFAHAHDCEPYASSPDIPELMRRRLLALRGYDASDRMVECDLVEGTGIESLIERFFTNPEVAAIHVHNARAGCYLCRIERGEAA